MSRYISLKPLKSLNHSGFLLLTAFLLIVFLIGTGFRSDTLPYPPGELYSDSSIRYPDSLHIHRSLREAHTLPLWNSHLMGGQPFAANPGIKIWYLLTWMLFFLEPALHINLMTAFHLWLGAAGMWFWARRTGLRDESAALASLAYLFAPKLIADAGIGHLDLVMAAAWFPWLLYSLQVVLTEESPTPFSILRLAFVPAMIFLSAIQLTPFLCGTGSVYAIWLLWNGDIRRLRLLMMAAVFAVGFAAALWIPLFEMRDSLSRGSIREQDAAIFSLQPGRLLGMLIGDHGGNAEGITYVGISVLLLALVGLILRPHYNLLWWGIVAFSILYALGDNFIIWTGLVRIFPPLLWFRVPARSWFIIALLMPYLAGWGLQMLLEKPPDSARARLLSVAIIGMGLTCSFAGMVILRDTEINLTALIGVFALPLTAFLIALVIFKKLDSRFIVSLMIGLVVLDCIWMGRTLIEGRPRDEWLDESPPDLIAYLAETGGRIYTPDYAIPQQDTAYWGIARFDGIEPFQIGTFVEATVPATGIPREGYSTTVPAVIVLDIEESSQAYKNAPMDARLLGQWGVEWVITHYEIDIEGLTFVSEEDGLYFYKNDFGWGDSVRLEWQSPNRVIQTITETADENIKTVVNVSTWRQESDHSRLDRDLLSLPPRSGEFRYNPAGIVSGILLTLGSYAAAAGWLAWSHFRDRS